MRCPAMCAHTGMHGMVPDSRGHTALCVCCLLQPPCKDTSTSQLTVELEADQFT